MSANTVKSWAQIVRVREDVRTGQLSLQEFAADLFDVVNRTGKRPLYEDPAKFFSLSYATSAQRDIAAATAERLRGKSDKAIRQLELTYGGGKTHTLITLTHLFRDSAALPELPAVKEFLSAMGGDFPKARVAAVCFDKLDPELGVPVRSPSGEQRTLKYPWSIIAFQVAGADGLRVLRADGKDEERETPPRDLALEKLLEMPGEEGLATLILFDEVLMYAGEMAKDPIRGEQFREQFLNFLQSLTQAVAKVSTASMIVSLLASDPKRDDPFGRQLLSDMSNIMGRKEDEPFQPVGKDDVAEILRRRLLDPDTIRDQEAFRPNVVAMVKALSAIDPEFAKTAKQRDDREKQYLASFPFDPAMMEVFYTKWTSGLPLFQRTRGVLRSFAVALRDAETWDTAPIAGASILLAQPGEDKLSPALSDLAGVARVDQVDGPPQDWVAILQGELRFAREAQEQLPALTGREVEQAVAGTFLHSQPQGANHASITDLYSLLGASKPDKIALEKGLQSWATRSWFLDEMHLDSAEKRADGSRGVPKTWRLGFQPNLKQMHDDARVNRVGKSAVDEMLLDEIKIAKWLDAGASTLGARVHKLPTGPDQVPNDGEFRYVILGPNAQSESGKPSASAVRFCEEVTGPHNPRSAKNAIVIAAPDRAGMAQAQERVKDYLAWLEVKAQLSSQAVDPVRSSMLDSAVSGSKKDIVDAIRQAYCIVVTRGSDDSVIAFKVTVDPAKPLFTTIKEDSKSRITDVALAPDALLPGSGSGFDLWREDEDRRRVKTIVGAFAEQPKLPKMLRRKDLLDTVANGCEQGLFVLSLQRPDGSARTWWRTQIDEEALNDDALEAVQNPAAILDGIDASLLAPSKLEGLDWKNGVKVADLISYFGGYVLTIDHPEDGWTEQKPIPRCPEGKILEAVAEAVKAGSAWLASGTASIWGELPPPGIVSKTAILRIPPQPIDVSSLTPEALPDAWSGGKATAHSIEQAVAAQRGVTSMPWKLVEAAITGALNSGFLRVFPGAVSWPCQFHEAASLELGLPEVTPAGGQYSPVMQEAVPKSTYGQAGFRSGVLDSSQLTELVEAMGDVLAAAGNLTLRFKVTVEFAEGEMPTPEVAVKLGAALNKATEAFG
ncbi:DUF499 domain-containing protein [Bradyrhizobium sp. 192]|uniref:DUF499 domain-containing protein n=1 Tax=Bradyrhizobium sp. 192 TaxID=2782660 RepID=UPI001FFF4581|nr:DUF499 domain-containing protein [Bradyrhizobium sp. 192]UPJ59725.1 ATP-binding protein [Bradyrhizobium sp. 192]